MPPRKARAESTPYYLDKPSYSSRPTFRSRNPRRSAYAPSSLAWRCQENSNPGGQARTIAGGRAPLHSGFARPGRAPSSNLFYLFRLKLSQASPPTAWSREEIYGDGDDRAVLIDTNVPLSATAPLRQSASRFARAYFCAHLALSEYGPFLRYLSL